MNKSDLIESVTKTTALARRDAENAVNAVVHTVMSELRAGRRVAVAGFGSFNPTRRGARTGRNPQTGAPVKISASKGVRFAASTAFKDVVNGRSVLAAPKVAAAPAAKATAKKATAKKASAKKAAAKKAGARKSTAKKSTAKKSTARKTATRRPASKKSPARKSTARKSTARKSTARKSTARKAPARKSPARKTAKRR